jgi:hypothetical protein
MVEGTGICNKGQGERVYMTRVQRAWLCVTPGKVWVYDVGLEANGLTLGIIDYEKRKLPRSGLVHLHEIPNEKSKG